MNFLMMVGVAPLSWRLGLIKEKVGKVVYAVGPLRLSFHDLSLH